MKKILIIILLFAAGISNKTFAQDDNAQARQLLHSFKIKAKLNPETGEVNYRGLSKPQLQPKLNSLLNVVADDFIKISGDGVSSEKFEDYVRIGLTRFGPYYADLDIEDKKRICAYFTELMEDVNLESPDAILTNWINGYDPAVK